METTAQAQAAKSGSIAIRSTKDDPALPSEFIGATGTTIYGGYFAEEYLRDLVGKSAIAVFEEMRRSDGQVRMVLSAIKNPIKSAKFSHDAIEGDPQSEEIARFLNWVWFKSQFVCFPKFLGEALTFLDFGHAVFEKIFAVYDHDEFGLVHTLGGLGFRKQSTIERWLIDPKLGLTGINQMAYGDTATELAQNVVIPASRLVLFANEQEGDNYEGISLLRACYGPWFRKNLYLKLNAIGIEKAAIGTPVGKYPKGAETTTQRQEFLDMLSNFAVHEQSFIAHPDGYEVDVVKIDFDSEKIMAAIAYEDTQMSKSILFQFLELGQNGGSGSYSLGADQSDIALSAIQFVGDAVCAQMNAINKQLVEMNFGKVDTVPQATCSGINSKAGKDLADAVKTLVDSRVVRPDDRLERRMRELYNLPEAETMRADDPEGGQEETPSTEPPAPKTKPVDKPDDDQEPAEEMLAEGEATGFKSFRPLTIYERPLNLSENVKEHAGETDKIYRTMKTRLEIIIAKAIRNLQSILAKNDGGSRAQAVQSFGIDQAGYKAALQKALGSAVAVGTEQARREMQAKLGSDVKLAEGSFTVDTEYLPPHVKAALILQAQMQADSHSSDIRKKIIFTIMGAEDGNLDDAKLIAKIQKEMDDWLASPQLESAARTITSQAVNRGRDGFFFDKANLKFIQGFQYSAILDERTTDICLALDGKIFRPGEQDDSLRPPNHHGCRSILIPITIKEEKPQFTGLDIDPTNQSLIDEYEARGQTPPDMAAIKKSRNL